MAGLTKTIPAWRTAGLRYYKYSDFIQRKFGQRIHRVTVDAGFTCPNADGTVAVGGCIYCDNRSFSPARRLPQAPLEEQVRRGIEFQQQLYPRDGYFVYFQPATNTYAPVARLKELFDQAVRAHPLVRGFLVGTRPDCVPNEVLDLLESYTKDHFVGLELGLQSIHQKSLDWMNRAHDAQCFFDAIDRCRGRGLDVSTHVILGLPGETRAEMLAMADALCYPGIDGVKIHNLHVVRNTPMLPDYHKGKVPILERDEYVELLIDFLERLPSTMVIHRVTGDAPAEYLVAPKWPLRKAEFLYALDQRMQRRNTWQGRLRDLPEDT